MIIKNVSLPKIDAALANTNAKHGYKLIYKEGPKLIGKRYQLTIRSEKSKIRGARTSYSGRNIPAASWHAHGHFFDEIFALEPAAVIRTGQTVYDAQNREWKDWNAGSQMYPVQMSELSIF